MSKDKKAEAPKRIFDVDINRDTVKDLNLDQLKKTDIFSHLSEKDQATAYRDLYNESHPDAVGSAPKLAADASGVIK